MYPKEILFGMDLYSILIAVGVIICMVFIRLQADWRGLRARLQNLYLFNTIAAVVLGYGCAVLLQAFYNFMAKGKFEITNSTGSTFYGGLIGGTALFIILYFVAGHFLFKDKYHYPHLRTASDMAPACITGDIWLFRLDTLLTNGRAPLYLQLPMIVLWFSSMLHLLVGESLVVALLLQRAFPTLDGRLCSILASLGAVLAFASPLPRTLPSSPIPQWLFIGILAAAIPGRVVLHRKKGGQNPCA